MPLTVKLPSTLNAKTMYGLIAAAVDDDQQLRDKEIHFDFSGLRFGQPSGMTVISNLIEWLGKRGVKGEFVGLDKDQRAIQYMDDCGFFNEYTGSALRDGAEVRDTTIPFRKIVCEQSHQWLDQTVCPFPLPIILSSAHPTCALSLSNVAPFVAPHEFVTDQTGNYGR